MIQFWKFITTPRLYMIYGDATNNGLYKPNAMERWSDKVITLYNTALKIAVHISPFIALYIYKYGCILEQKESWLKIITCVGGFITLSYITRACGRARNATYTEFLNKFNNANWKPNSLDIIRQYDFEFTYWPTTFQMPLLPNQTTYLSACLSFMKNHPYKKCANTDLPFHQQIFIQTLANIAIHTFGLRMIYPGSLSFIYALMSEHLLYGRKRFVEEYNGIRAKIATADGNIIDTMFVDNKRTSNGKTLVICCEGNSGFYEDGIMNAPTKAGYSTLGWNHPGFGWSTGLPYPSQETNAVDAVMQYAIKSLGFAPENIVLYGWSIGGYPATWIACNYPIKGLILDATFDDLLPLALNQMPQSWSRLVKEVVRSYVNLDIATMLKQYEGPIKLIRRTEDEIMCLKRGDISSNRCNDLLKSIISQRYPNLVEDQNKIETLDKFIAMTASKRSVINVNNFSSNSAHQLRLISHYMRDFKSTHCIGLHESFFSAIMSSFSDNVTLSKN